jgi:predicted dehydrogenase
MFTIREHRYPFLEKVGDWNRFSRHTGGTMVEKCCHFFDLMRLATGAEPVRIYASGGQDVNHLDERYAGEQPDIVDAALTIVDFDNGVRASLELCMYAEGGYFQEQITAVGDRGKVEAFIPAPARFQGDGEQRDAEIVVSPRESQTPRRRIVEVDAEVLAAGDHHGATYFQHRELLRAICEGGTPAVSLHDGALAVRMGVAAETSIRSGQSVEMLSK